MQNSLSFDNSDASPLLQCMFTDPGSEKVDIQHIPFLVFDFFGNVFWVHSKSPLDQDSDKRPKGVLIFEPKTE
jgi:hypothetical protein